MASSWRVLLQLNLIGWKSMLHFQAAFGSCGFLKLPIRNNYNFSDGIIRTFSRCCYHWLTLASVTRCSGIPVSVWYVKCEKTKDRKYLKRRRGEVLSSDVLTFPLGLLLWKIFHPLPSVRIFLRLFWNSTYVRDGFQCANH